MPHTCSLDSVADYWSAACLRLREAALNPKLTVPETECLRHGFASKNLHPCAVALPYAELRITSWPLLERQFGNAVSWSSVSLTEPFGSPCLLPLCGVFRVQLEPLATVNRLPPIHIQSSGFLKIFHQQKTRRFSAGFSEVVSLRNYPPPCHNTGSASHPLWRIASLE